MRRFISTDLVGKLIPNQSIILPKAAQKHLLKVLRLKDGDQVELCDGHGTSTIGKLFGPEIEIGNIEKHPEPARLCVVISLIKSERFRMAVEKLAELGVTEIRPLLANRSQMKIPANKLESRLTKWRLIAENATRQSGRYYIPKLYPPDSPTNISKLNYDHILTSPEGSTTLLRAENPAIWVGPEGGFNEIELALFKDFKELYLSDAILRTETAAIVATALVQKK